MIVPVILIVDDDKDICIILAKFLSRKNFEVLTAYSGEEGLVKIRTKPVDLVLCDYRLPDVTGVEMLRKIKLLKPTLPVIIITGYSDVRTAVETFRYGASDYVTKPLYPDELLVTIQETIAKNAEPQRVGDERAATRSTKSSSNDEFDDFITGVSAQALTVQKHAELIAPSDMSVIIQGETGTGKEYIAKSIHKLSSRRDRPFVAIDCGALPSELAGSELFGHMKGSFTGAISDKEGSFELANTGTIFLDEIGNLSHGNQAKLLRVLQERRIKRIGATKDIAIDVRIITATNEDLMTMVSQGVFREDLYHRLNEFKIIIAPLRDRKDDILLFASHFLERANKSLNKNVLGFSDEAVAYVKGYYWHGNLRELNNVVKRAVLLTEGEWVMPDSLPQEILHIQNNGQEHHMDEEVGMLKAIVGTAERQAIIETLEKVNYNKTRAAEILRIDRKTLYNKLKLYNIEA